LRRGCEYRDPPSDRTSAGRAIYLDLFRAGRSALVAIGCGGSRLGIRGPSLIIGVNNSWAENYGLVSLIVLGAPISEEIAKAAILPFLAVSRRVTWFVDGAVLGAAAGTGFAIRENWLYLEGVGSSDSISLVIARATSTNLMHAVVRR